MGWVYLDDNFPEHPKVLAAGDQAGWMYVCGLAYTNRGPGDGTIPKVAVPRLTSLRNSKEVAQRLVDAGLWHDKGDHFKVHDYEEWNARQMARRVQARRAALTRWGNAHASGEHMRTHSGGSADAMPSPIPIPIPNSDSSLSHTRTGGHERLAASPPESGNGKAPWKTDPLVDRWCAEVTGNQRTNHRMQVWRVIEHLKGYVDVQPIDETIGRLAQLDQRVTSPNYLLATVTSWAAERDITIPAMAAGK